MLAERTRISWLATMVVLVLLVTSGPLQGLASQRAQANQILHDAGIRGGLIVHLGCGDGKLTAALRAGDSYMVQGLDGDAENVGRAREHVRTLGSYGNVSIDHFRGERLPYIDNLVNLLISENLGDVSMDEVMRVLAPEGVAYIKTGGKWNKSVKPRPREMDEWTHFLYDATGNAAANDSLVGPPRHVQWIGSPKWSRHHDHLPSLSALVSAGGRVFYVIDEGAKASILLPPKWALVARDAFNGVVLWKRPLKDWHPHLWPMKSGPTQPARRLIALEDRVYVTLGRQAPLSVLDAATGEIVRTCDGTYATEEVIASDGTLLVLVNDAPVKFGEYRPKHPDPRDERDRVALEWPWDEKERWIAAIKADTGNVLWKKRQKVVPLTLAADGKRVVFYDGERIVGLNKMYGEQLWRSAPIDKASPIPASFAPTLVLYEDVVLLSTGLQQLTAVSADSGKTLWTDDYSPMGHHCSEDVLVVNGLAWTGATAGGRDSGVYTGRDLLTGQVKSEFPPDVTTYWFHQRCYRSKATGQYILPSRTGIEFVDVTAKHWTTHHWVRGGCAYGTMPSNGLIYAPPHSCACYMEAMLHGFSALAPQRKASGSVQPVDRLEKGPAFGELKTQDSKLKTENDWPTYRHDQARSSCTKNQVPTALKPAWQKDLGGRLSAAVIAENKLFVASVDAHTVYALDANSGTTLWSFMVGGRVDSPPTIYRGRALLGSADGWVYCLRAADGALIWRFRAAPDDLRLVAFEQLESVWPVHGSVLVQDGVVHCVAGRSMFVDGGMRLLRLDAETGRKLSETVLDDRDPESGRNLQAKVRGLNMPVALPDILSSDGQNLYMRSQAFDLEGVRRPAGSASRHLFCPTGFLDDAWLHRSYWLFGTSYTSGAGGYYQAGRRMPAGRILAFDESTVYGYGRKPEYYRWVTPLDYRLFAAAREPEVVSLTRQGTTQQPGSRTRGRRRPATGARIGAATAQRDKPPYAGASPAVARGFKPQFQLPPTTKFDCRWSGDTPLHVRAMVLADKTLLIAGPLDMIDEEQAVKSAADPETQAKLAEQNEAFEGRRGGLLQAVSTLDGEKLAELSLESVPVWDGMAAAYGQVYLSLKNGKILCIGPR